MEGAGRQPVEVNKAGLRLELPCGRLTHSYEVFRKYGDKLQEQHEETSQGGGSGAERLLTKAEVTLTA